MKILVISDLHFPLPYSGLYAKVIKKERPDVVVLLGDVVAPSSPSSAVAFYKRFVKGYKKVFDTSKTVFLLGDNEGRCVDYSINKEVSSFLDKLPKLNKDLLTYKYKNLFFFHGNIEHSFSQERSGYLIVKILTRIHEALFPFVLSSVIRYRFGLSRNEILFIGHIHYLGKVGKNIFCGTFNKEKKIYNEEKSLGYVTIVDRGGKEIKAGDVSLISLLPLLSKGKRLQKN